MNKLILRFVDIQNINIYKGVLWMIGEFTPKSEIENAITEIKKAVGNLPIE